MFDGPNQNWCPSFGKSNEACVYVLTEREQRIIATIIQWLGTNVGFHFMGRCLRRAGYVIKEFDTFKEPEPESETDKIGRFRILEES